MLKYLLNTKWRWPSKLHGLLRKSTIHLPVGQNPLMMIRGIVHLLGIMLLAFSLSGCLQTAKNTGPPGNSHNGHPLDQLTAGILGTAAAQVVWRKGRLSTDISAVATLIHSLRPLDIIVAKNGHHLTDKILPGYFTHAMIWVGGEKELRQLGLWTRPALRPVQKAIREGRTVLDIDYHGVRLAHHDTLADSDALVVIRMINARGPVATRQRYRLIADNLGLHYDFAFDLDTPRQVSCTEFTARLYPEINWTYRSFLARRQLLPDDIVYHALKGRQLSVISYLVRSPKTSLAQLRSRAALRMVLEKHRMVAKGQNF